MPTEAVSTRMTSPRSVEEALRDLADGMGAVPVGGATWVMRAPLRHEAIARRYVALNRIDGFDRLDIGEATVSIGPLVTHDRLARLLPPLPGLCGLRAAASRAANPGVRHIATIGGNLCAANFAASDFAPALLSLDAAIEIADARGRQLLSMEEFLSRRGELARPWLVTGIVVPANTRLTAHERLPMRRAGDYPCAIVSVSVALDSGRISDLKVGVGAVEAVARHWHSLERALVGRPLITADAEQAARDLASDFTGRDAIDAPGWYRSSVLPVLVRRAFATIESMLAGGMPCPSN